MKNIIALIILLLACGSAGAQKMLTVLTTDGSSQSISLAIEPKVTIEKDNLLIVSDDIRVEFDVAKVKKFLYETDTVVNIAEVSSSFTHRGGRLIFNSQSDDTQLTICNTAGIVLFSGKVRAGETHTVSLADYVAGVYLVQFGNVTSKILKQ